MDTSKRQALTAYQVSDRAAGESPEVTALVDRAKSGDDEAFDDLMRLYERRVISLGLQMGLSLDDALDACQDAFVKVFRYIQRFRSGQSFFKWLYRIAIHAIYDHMRKGHPVGVVSVEDLSPSQVGAIRETGPSIAERVESADLAGKILAGLDGLSRRERIVFVLRDLQGMDTAAIGAILRLSQVTVRRHCMEARQKLRQRVFPRKD
jgi:RNA polymerase sigma-70 factor (ECF subfamily)